MIQYSVFLPEIWMVGAAVLILLWDLVLPKDSNRDFLSWVAGLGLAGALAGLPCIGNIGCMGACPIAPSRWKPSTGSSSWTAWRSSSRP